MCHGSTKVWNNELLNCDIHDHSASDQTTGGNTNAAISWGDYVDLPCLLRFQSQSTRFMARFPNNRQKFLTPPHPHKQLIDALGELWNLEWRKSDQGWMQCISDAEAIKSA